MCSLTDSALDPALVNVKQSLTGSDLTCKKCRVTKSVVNLRVKDTYCQTCFLVSVQHKMRATLGKHKATRPGDHVLVSASGGQNSTALLHLLQQGVHEDIKKLMFVPQILYIDEGVVLGESNENRTNNISEMREMLQRFGFSVSVVLMEQYCDSIELVDVYSGMDGVVFNQKYITELTDCFSGLKDGTARQELLLNIRRAVMVRVAKLLNCSKIFTGENGTNLAIDLLAGVASGAGISLPDRVGFRDKRDDEVVILRPMRDVSSKEVALYSMFHKLPSLCGKDLGTGKDSLWSIRKLTEEFLIGLQNDFPSTIPTVFKTGDKLSSIGVEQNTDDCLLCGGSLDTSEDSELSSLQATQFSSRVSGNKLEGKLELKLENFLPSDVDRLCDDTDKSKNDSSGECCGEGDGSCQSGKQGTIMTARQIEQWLCYTCRRTTAGAKHLPGSLIDKVNTRFNRTKMRDEISDYLL